MNKRDDLQKSLDKIKSSEKGWRKSLNTAKGSYSQNLARENLRRLADQRAALLNAAASGSTAT